MTSANLETCLTYFRKSYKDEDAAFGYYNLNRRITKDDIKRLERFITKYNKIRLCYVVDGTSWLRPQRTFGDLPEWVRSAYVSHKTTSADSCFIFMSWIPEPKFETQKAYRQKVLDFINKTEEAKSVCKLLLDGESESVVYRRAKKNLKASIKDFAKSVNGKYYFLER